MNRKIVSLGALLVVFGSVVITGCGAKTTTAPAPTGSGASTGTQVVTPAAPSQLTGKLSMKGSGSGVDVARKVGEKFSSMHPGVTLDIPDSVGSSEGIKAVADGAADIGFSSRDLKEKEKGLGVTAIQIGSAPLVFAVHPSVTGVTNINRDQIVPIFSGKVKNWKELGGPDAPIIPIVQQKGDSDRALLEKEIAGFAEMTDSPNAMIVADSDAVAPVFNKTNYSITMIKYEDLRNGAIKGVPLMLDGVTVSETTTKSGKYTLGKPVYFVFRGEPQGLAKQFVDFVLSAEGQGVVAHVGLVPLKTS